MHWPVKRSTLLIGVVIVFLISYIYQLRQAVKTCFELPYETKLQLLLPVLHDGSHPLEKNDHASNLMINHNCQQFSDEEAIICQVQSSLYFYHYGNPTAIVRDISIMNYFAQRDLQGWSMLLSNLSFNTAEYSQRSPVPLNLFNFLLCLAINNQDVLCLKKDSYVHLTQGQRVNQFYNARNIIWRKDTFCDIMNKVLLNSPINSDFIFQCWNLPKDLDKLKPLMEGGQRDFIVKPSDSGEGHGIFITRNFTELTSDDKTNFVVQPLLTDPLLVEGRKVDLRTYVLVTSVLPLRAYFYKEGLVRFASTSYNTTTSSNVTKDERQFLTNTSVGKKYMNLANLTWTFEKLRSWLTKQGHAAEKVFEDIKLAIVKTLLTAEYGFAVDYATNLYGYSCQQCFQLLGVDVLLDSKLNPKIIEINGLPSMQLSHELGVPPNLSSVYTQTKLQMLGDLFRIVFRPTDVMTSLMESLQLFKIGISPGPFCKKGLHMTCIDRKDIETLINFKREYMNRGGFSLIYPHSNGEELTKLIRHVDSMLDSHRHTLPIARTSHRYHRLLTSLLRLQHAKEQYKA